MGCAAAKSLATAPERSDEKLLRGGRRQVTGVQGQGQQAGKAIFCGDLSPWWWCVRGRSICEQDHLPTDSIQCMLHR
eukprot:s2004_g13.t1